jgi:hypothetical protein
LLQRDLRKAVFVKFGWHMISKGSGANAMMANITRDASHASHGTIEQKYVFVNPLKGFLQDWLDHCCVRDSNFYIGTVSSIYFDTPGMDLYYEKRNSDYLKLKIRLRWYADIQKCARDEPVKCYLEVKSKKGVIREKQRVNVSVPARVLSGDPFSDEQILNLPYQAYEWIGCRPAMLVPTMLIRYERRRFIDPESSSRISLDTDISCPQANARYISGFPPVHLGTGVLEVKGRHHALPYSFMPIQHHLTKEAFSKYARCCEHLMQSSEGLS